MSTNIQKRNRQLKELSRNIERQKGSINDEKRELSNLSPITVEYHFFEKGLVEDLNKAFSEISTHNRTIVAKLTDLLTIQNGNTQLLCNIMLSLSTAELSLYTKVRDITKIQKTNSKNIDFLVDEFVKSIDDEGLSLEKKIDAFENLMDGTHDDIASIINGLAEESKQHTNNIQSHTDRFANIQTEIQGAITQYTQYYSDIKQQIATLETELPQKVSTSIFKEELNKKADSSALCQYVKTDDSRLTDARPASDIYPWAKGKQKPSYTADEVGALSKDTKISEIDGFSEEHQRLESKQDKINDLEKIRSGATLGATAIQKHQDISGKQDIIADLDSIRRGAALGATAIQEHQDISGKADISFVEDQLKCTKNNLNQEVTALRQTLQKTQEDLQKEQQEHIKLKRALITTSICTGTISVGALIALLILIL